MDIVDWILISIAGLNFAVIAFVLWLGPPTRHPGARSTRRK